MIKGAYTYIRGTEQDDVPALAALYQGDGLRAGLLDGRREPMTPTRNELRELLTHKEVAEGGFYTVEDRTGQVLGFCSLRGVNPEAKYGEFSLLLLDPGTYAGPMAEEAGQFLFDRAFVRLGLCKVVAYCLAHERELADYLQRAGFENAGVQREVLYARGHWHDLQAFSKANPPPRAA